MSVKPWDLLNSNEPRSEEYLKEQRLSICRQCPEYIKLTTMCKKCGCIMEFKTRLENAQCPIGKW
jgi:ribosomal protein L32